MILSHKDVKYGNKMLYFEASQYVLILLIEVADSMYVYWRRFE